MATVQVTTRFDETTLRPAAEAHLRHRHPWFSFLRWVYLIGLAALGIWFLGNGDQPFGFVCLILSPVLFARKYLAVHRILAGARTSPQWGSELHWTFEDKKIIQKSDTFQTTLQWSDLFECVRTPRLLLLYPQKHVFFAIPLTNFQSQGDVKLVLELAGLKA